jgi:hypothetical protein
LSRYAIERNGNLVKHVVFEANNDNYPASNVVIIAYESLKDVQELIKIWPDASIFDLKNNLHVVPESGII